MKWRFQIYSLLITGYTIGLFLLFGGFINTNFKNLFMDEMI
jgi:hypothetical protein